MATTSDKKEQKEKRMQSPLVVETSGGRTVYGLSLETFPAFYGNVYVIDDGSRRVLVDCGSGFGSSNEQLVKGLESLTEHGGTVRLEELDAVLITHGHIDHFGGLQFVREKSPAPVAIHPLDRRVLSRYEESVVTASHRLGTFLAHSGLSEESRDRILAMYKAQKVRFHSLPVDLTLEEGEPVVDGRGQDLELEVFHVPGHCPGQVCLKVDDVLLTADHVLSRITPHQAPESLTLHTGLSHYLASLRRVEKLDGVRLGLGGHELPMDDVAGRARDIRGVHQERLEQIADLCREPQTTLDVSKKLFGTLGGYGILLGLEETGAHIEYLYQRGELAISNLDEVSESPTAATLYVAV